MELRQLRYFATLAEELHFGRAAARLHISQPPLTRQIQQLEEELGTPLFNRNTRGVELTLAGKSLFADARRILGQVSAAKERTCKAGRGQVGRLDVGIYGSAILSHIPQVLLRFRDCYPEVEIVLHQSTKAEQIEALRQKTLTVGFNRHVPAEPDIMVETMFYEPLVVALGRGNPLARRKTLLVEEFADQPLILYPSNTRPGFADDVMALFLEADLKPNVIQEVTDFVTAIALVACGFGVCVTPKAASSLRLPGVVYRPIDALPEPPSIELACLYRRDDESPILAAFLDVARKVRPVAVE